MVLCPSHEGIVPLSNGREIIRVQDMTRTAAPVVVMMMMQQQ
jgi:hypothetical protein